LDAGKEQLVGVLNVSIDYDLDKHSAFLSFVPGQKASPWKLMIALCAVNYNTTHATFTLLLSFHKVEAQHSGAAAQADQEPYRWLASFADWLLELLWHLCQVQLHPLGSELK